MLNQLQDKFVNNMLININNSKYGMYLLEAPAGCGKTYCVTYLLKKLKIQSYVIAPTHKAKQMLKKNIGNACKNIETIHRFLGGKLVYTKDGTQKYIFNAKCIKNSLIFIDECSMINDEIYELLKEYSENNFVIFAGDNLQLPPIYTLSENDEEITFKNKKSKTFNKTLCIEYFELTENMRARENPIGVFLINKARESIKAKIIPDFIAKTDIKSVLDLIKKDKLTDFIILAYSNLRVNYYNKLIRAHLYGNGSDVDLDDYYINERLIFSGYRKCKNVTYHTSDIIKIDSISTENQCIYYKTCKCYTELKECKQCGISNHNKKYLDIEFWKIIDQKGTVWYKPKSEIDKRQFYKLQKHFKEHCIKIKDSDLWCEYYNFINRYNSDLRYAYASTIHKSQGDEWKYVFLDRKNLIQCAKDSLLRLTAYYTAVSRMKKEVYEIIE